MMISNGRHPIAKPARLAPDSRQSVRQGPAVYSEVTGERPGLVRGENSVAAMPLRPVGGPQKTLAGPGRLIGGRPEAGPPIFSKLTIIISAGLHLALVCFIVFGLPSCQGEQSGIDPSQVVTVQLLSEPSPPPPPPVEATPVDEAAPEPKPVSQPPAFELPLGESSRNLQRSGRAEAEAEEDSAPSAPPEDQLALGPKVQPPPPELEKRRDRKPEVKPPAVKRQTEPRPPQEPDYSKVPQALYRTLGRDAGAMHFGSRQGRRTDPVVSRYFELALAKFNENWTTPQGLSPDLVVGLALTIEPNGRISYVQITKPSGSTAYDRSVERAIKMASPLSPLPSVFGGQRISQSFYFTPEGMGRRRR